MSTEDLKLLKSIVQQGYKSIIMLSRRIFPHHRIDPVTGKSMKGAEIHKEMDELLRGALPTVKDGKVVKRGYNLLMILPRGVGKSTFMDIFYMAWILLFTNKRYIILIGATSDSIGVHFKALKDEIKNNKILHLLGIKPLQGGEDNGKTFDVVGANIPGIKYLTGEKRVRIEAYSATSFQRGLKYGSIRPDLILIDDLEMRGKGNRAGVESAKYREEIARIFKSEIVPSAFSVDSCQIIISGTIMQEDQLLYKLYDNSVKGLQKNPRFKYIKRSMIENYGTEKAKSIWPEKLSLEDFEDMMDTARLDGTTSLIYNEYLSEPAAPDDIMFGDFRYFLQYGNVLKICNKDGIPIDGLPAINLQHCVLFSAGDLAFTVSSRSDYTAFATVALDKDGNIFVLNIHYGKWLPGEIEKQICSQVDRYLPDVVGVEDVAMSKATIETLKALLYKELGYTNVINIPARGNKVDRMISNLHPVYNRGKIYHLYNGHYKDELEEQLIGLTKDGIKTAHDDVMESLSYAVQISRDDYNSRSGNYVDDTVSELSEDPHYFDGADITSSLIF